VQRYTHKVTFSTDRETFAHLEARAEIAGMTPHQVARDLLEAKLKDRDEHILLALNLIAEKLDAVAQQTEKNTEQLTTLRDTLGDDLRGLAPFLNQLFTKVNGIANTLNIKGGS